MSVIGTFTPAKDGGWTGSIRTLLMNAKVRLVPNDNRENENAPAFRVLVGHSRIGDAWEARSGDEIPRSICASSSMIRVSANRSTLHCFRRRIARQLNSSGADAVFPARIDKLSR
jgi:hypothetical protein